MRFLRSSCRNLRGLLVLTLLSLAFSFTIKTFWNKDEDYNKMRRTLRSSAKKEIRDILETLKVKFKIYSSESQLNELSNPKGRRIFVFIFENLLDYYTMKTEGRALLDDYCRKNRAGVIGLAWPGPTKDTYPTEKPMYVISNMDGDADNFLVHNQTILSLLKHNIPYTGWTDFVAFNWLSGTLDVLLTAGQHPLVLYEPSQINGIPKIVISRQALPDWVFKLIIMDSLQFVSNYKESFQYIQIDIDDIFVGSARLTKEDVVALIQSQNNIAKNAPGFRYNLGFSGSTFAKGTPQENEGDELLIEYKNKFNWFPHMWRHIQPHKFSNESELIYRMQKNYNFAVEKGLPVNGGYSVAPHHSGVFPVHEQLYSAWVKVWGIKATSTEEYPSLYPARRRRGFIYRNISVLPRQTCGLFTKNLYYDEYPGGPVKMEQSVAGGEIFETILTNPISVFMTHMPNYCCDRLAPYLFESLINFVKCFTNLQLISTVPVKLANKYFDLFPDERKPVWSNPCKDKRHIEIYSQNKSCDQLPNTLVVGPQKTGSTALHAFLKLHPNIVSNEPSPETFEELQFFNNDKYYLNGLDWYKQFFPSNTSMTNVVFEKSATYFDADIAPQRAHRLLPTGKIVILLIPPEDRAYSWYQHMRAHDLPTAINNSFDQVVRASAASPKDLLSLRSRCLEPGKYGLHINKWLMYFRPKQIYIMDGSQLKKDPVTAMNNLQKFLEVPFIDYKTKLMFDSRKGFYCSVMKGRKKCLGKGKGREYPPLAEDTKSYLKDYYSQHNAKLLQLLAMHKFPIPSWLKALGDGVSPSSPG